MSTVNQKGIQLSSFSDRLRAERERLGFSQTAFGEACGVTKGSQINYETEKRFPDGEYLMKAADLGADVLFIVTGVRGEASLPKTMGDWLAGITRRDMAALMELPPSDFTELPLYDAFLAAGHGADNSSEDVVDSLAFRRSWLREIGVSSSNAVLARAQGDSMQPTIFDGDLVMIDVGERGLRVQKRDSKVLRRAPIYAILDGGLARIKRLDRPEPDVVVMLSDNPAFPPEVLTGSNIDDLHIIGAVRWWAHTNRD